MKILGIDPGYGKCGWAVLAKDEPNRELRIMNHELGKSQKNKFLINSPTIHNSKFIIQLIACDCIETHKNKILSDRLKEIYDGVQYVVKKYQPSQLAIESLFWFKNKKTALTVAQARGVIIVAAKNLGLEIYEYTPLQVKQAVVGYGRADKKQIQRMIKIHLCGQCVPKQDDTADAIAIGLTHLQTRKFDHSTFSGRPE